MYNANISRLVKQVLNFHLIYEFYCCNLYYFTKIMTLTICQDVNFLKHFIIYRLFVLNLIHTSSSFENCICLLFRFQTLILNIYFYVFWGSEIHTLLRIFDSKITTIIDLFHTKI